MECKVHRNECLSQNVGGRIEREGEERMGGMKERRQERRQEGGPEEREGSGKIDSSWRGLKTNHNWYILQALQKMSQVTKKEAAANQVLETWEDD